MVNIAPREAPGEPALQLPGVPQVCEEVLIHVVSVANISEVLRVKRVAVRSRGFFTNERRGVVMKMNW